MTKLLLLAASVVVMGCHHDVTTVQPTSSDLAPPLASPARDKTDLIVATVDGRPIWASCVSQQMSTAHVDRQRALTDCIDFDVLAATAGARHLGSDPETQFDLRTALVNGIVTREFEDRIATPSDLPAALLKSALEKNKNALDAPEWREATYFRGNVAADVRVGSAPDQDALRVAQQIYDALPAKDGLFADDVREIAERVGAGHDLDIKSPPYRTPHDARTDPIFCDALFSLADIGSISPPVRTPWGWDLIMFTDRLNATKKTPEQLAESLFPELRRAYFSTWFGDIVRTGGHDVQADFDALGDPLHLDVVAEGHSEPAPSTSP